MVGIALITGVTTVLSPTTASLTKLVDEQVQADLIISGEQSGPRPPTFDPAVLDRTGTLPGVEAVAGASFDVALVNGEREGVAGVNDLHALTRIASLRATAGSVDSFGAGQAVLDKETAAKAGVTVGQRVTMQFSRGEPRTLVVSGIYDRNEMVMAGWCPRSRRRTLIRSRCRALSRSRRRLGHGPYPGGGAAGHGPEVSVGDRGGSSTADGRLRHGAQDDPDPAGAGDPDRRTRDRQHPGPVRAGADPGAGAAAGRRAAPERDHADGDRRGRGHLGLRRPAGRRGRRRPRYRGRPRARVEASQLALPWTQMGTYLVLAAFVRVLAAVLPAIRPRGSAY
jgi:hypothetical protein